MRKPADLDPQSLQKIVESIQGYLYLDLDQRGSEYWNPDKPISCADVCEHVVGLLGEHGLVPERAESFDDACYVLYDFDSEQLISTAVYASYPDAAKDAAGLDNVLIVLLKAPKGKRGTVDSQPVTVRLQSEEFGAEDFQCGDLQEALDTICRLYHDSLQQHDQVQRQIGILVGPSVDDEEDEPQPDQPRKET
jgi:hypothetical protein